MNSKFNDILNILHNKLDWECEEEFLRDAIFSGSIQLINKCYGYLVEYSLLVIPPLLRQIQENIVILIGLKANFLDSKKIIKGEINARKIFEKIYDLPDANKEDIGKVDFLLKKIKKLLNDEYSHSNVNGIMHYYFLEHHSDEVQQVNKLNMELLIAYLDIILTALINDVYELNIKLPDEKGFQKKFKELPSLKYADKNLPKEIKVFLRNSKNLSGYFEKKKSELSNEIETIRILGTEKIK